MDEIKRAEAEYLRRLAEGLTLTQRLEALEGLADQYLELYMTEYAAVCFLAGQEKKGRNEAKEQLWLFPGGPYERQAQRLLEEGVPAAREFLAQLGAQRGMGGGPSQPEAPTGTPSSAKGEETDPLEPPLPEPVARCLDGVVGMAGARQVLLALYDAVQVDRFRRGHHVSAQNHYHLLIRGAKGSGKTLLAHRVSQLLYELELAGDPVPCVLKSGHKLMEYLSGGGSDLDDALSQCEGRTVVVDGIGPILDGADSAGMIEVFCGLVEKYRENVNFILIGTEEEMDRLLSQAARIAWMFPYDIRIEPYTTEQLVQIAERIAEAEEYQLAPEALRRLEERLEVERGTPYFQNGTTIRLMLVRARIRFNKRVVRMGSSPSKSRVKRIEEEDVTQERPTGGRSYEELMEQLNRMTGLKSVKKKVRELAALTQVEKAGRQLGHKGKASGLSHMLFVGSPGTGKTTVARFIGSIYQALGVLPRGDKVIECGRGDLVGQFQGQTAPKIKAKVAEAMGGVLFIDEAYSLCRGDGFDTFGQEAVDTLTEEAYKHQEELIIILAGYPQEMDELMSQNTGLPSRFTERLVFEDYSQEEMEQIFLGMLADNDKRLAGDCQELFREYIATNRLTKDFGNARGIQNLCNRLIGIQSVRLSEQMAKNNGVLLDADYETILKKDLEQAMSGENRARKKTLEEWMKELDSLTGLEKVKKKVRSQSYAIKGHEEQIKRGLVAPGDSESLHMMFKGSPGTGKTTVARIIGGIYNTLGLLPSGDIFVECGRSDLVAEYQGQTAVKTKRMIDRAMGGVLFIDEAYSLCRDDKDSFGLEAIDTLTTEMDKHRESLMVILAGYSGKMDDLLKKNPGMGSRVPFTLTFEDYTQEEMFEIFRNGITGRGYLLSAGLEGPVRDLIAQRSRIEDFGNARGVRNIVEGLILSHNARIGEAMAEGGEQSDEALITITMEDLERMLEDENDEKKTRG